MSIFFGDPTAINSSSEFKDLIDLAHLTSNDLMYHSPVISDMPKATSFGNHTEDATIRLIEKMSESEIADVSKSTPKLGIIGRVKYVQNNQDKYPELMKLDYHDMREVL